MAGAREHVTVSTLLGVGYGLGASWGLGFETSHSALAGGLTALGGMMPDLDLPTSVPARELFTFTAAISPLLLWNRLESYAGSFETAILLAAGVYLIVRYGGAYLIKRLTVHRGMFHSIPAMLIAAELVFLCYGRAELEPRLLVAGGMWIGYLSHLLLDELYSIRPTIGGSLLARSAGSAFKLYSSSAGATLLTYLLLAALSYAILREEAPSDLPQWLEPLKAVWQRWL